MASPTSDKSIVPKYEVLRSWYLVSAITLVVVSFQMTMPSREAATIDYSNPCEKVRNSCRQWMEDESDWTQSGGRRSVAIHSAMLDELAQKIIHRTQQTESGFVEWDEENWHYQGKNFRGSEAQRQERVALYILALDAINFCFWPHKNYPTETQINSLEYEHLAVALKKMAEADDDNASNDHLKSFAFSPKNLSAMTEQDMTELLQPHLGEHYLDNMEKRSQLWKEVGNVLLQHFDGSIMNLISRANNSAPKLVELVFAHFDGFRDEVFLNSTERIVFLKRAQIFVGDVNAALNLKLQDMNQLTTFADYRVPQILRQYKVLEYSPRLSMMVDSGNEISKGSIEEISIRAGTVRAVELLVQRLNTMAGSLTEPFTDVNVDWSLWQMGEQMHREGMLKPFHKVRTHYY